KFTPRGGRVTIAVGSKDHHFRIMVNDTGAGIEADRLQEVFEMFQQGQAFDRRAPGLGLGLALVKSITELHGGRVWAASAGPGRGSRFTVELPVCEPPQAGSAPEVPGSGHKQIRMLLVEDNDDTRTMLAETFAGRSYEVVAAENAEAALDLLLRERVDVI